MADARPNPFLHSTYLVLICLALISRLCVAIDASTMAINPRFFGFSTYLGPIVNLSYSDPAVLLVAKTLRIGSLRYATLTAPLDQSDHSTELPRPTRQN